MYHLEDRNALITCIGNVIFHFNTTSSSTWEPFEIYASFNISYSNCINQLRFYEENENKS